MNISEEIKKAQQARRLHIAKGFTNGEQLRAEQVEADLAKSEETDIKKAEEGTKQGEEVDENPFEKAVNDDVNEQDPPPVLEDGEGVEKSDVMYALNGNDSIKFNKTGKEIKDQINSVVLPNLNAALATFTNTANTLLADCGNAPLKDIDSWWTNDIKLDVPFKVYSWDQTYMSDNSKSVSESLSVSDAEAKAPDNSPASKAEADMRQKYNEAVRKVCETMTDIKACEMLQELKDTAKFELSARQILTFGF